MRCQQALAFGVPPPFQFEAPTSWLTRLACAQGLGSMEELLRFLELPVGVDLDWHLRADALDDLRQRCRLPPGAFGIADRVMLGAEASGVPLPRLLMTGRSGASQFRVCPFCLAERRTAHLDIHWRFKCWRWCPIHNCMLIGACPNCNASIEHPRLIESSRSGRRGHFSLGRCLRCSASFAQQTAMQVAADSWDALDRSEWVWIRNGRAVLAALHAFRFTLQGRQYPIRSLARRYGSLVGERAGSTHTP